MGDIELMKLVDMRSKPLESLKIEDSSGAGIGLRMAFGFHEILRYKKSDILIKSEKS
jgi:hypothetical protein